MKKLSYIIILLCMVSIAQAINITVFDDEQAHQTSDIDWNNTFSIPYGSHVSLAQLNLDGLASQSKISIQNVTYISTTLEPEGLDFLSSNNTFYVVDKYHKIYLVNQTFGHISNITTNSTCGDGFAVPNTDHDYYGISVINDEIIYVLHQGSADADSLLLKINWSKGVNDRCRDYWVFSNVETIQSVEGLYVDDNEDFAYISQTVVGTNKIYKLNMIGCNDDCWSSLNWTLTSFGADSYDSLDSEDNGDHFWATNEIDGSLDYIDNTGTVLETYDIRYQSDFDAFNIQDTLGHTVNHSIHWILDTQTKDELLKMSIIFPDDVTITVNTTTVFNNTGFLRTSNKTINLSNKLIEDVLKEQDEIYIGFAANSYGNLTASNLTISYETLFQCDGSSTEVQVYNFTMTDEDNDTILTGDMTVDLVYNETILTYYEENTTSIAICMAQNTSNIVNGFVMGVDGYTNRYFLANANISSSDSQQIDFYNKHDVSSYSTLSLTVRDESFLPFPNIIGKLQRYYPNEHAWKTVQQDISDGFGQQFFSIIEQTTEYRAYFYRNSTQLDNTQTIKFICDAGVCQVSFQIQEEETDRSSIVINTAHNNNTGILNVSWNDGTGATSSVRVYVYKDTMTGTQDICDSTVSSPAGSVECNVSEYTGDVQVMVYTPATITIPTLNSFITLSNVQISNFLEVSEYALWSFILLLVFAGMGSVSPVAGVIMSIFGIFIISLLGINPVVNTIFIIVVSVIGIALGVKIKK